MGKKAEPEKTLRERAEKALHEKEMATLGKLSEADTLKLVHELQVHQVELELQNEELAQAHFIAQQSSDRYTGLYDFSPTGYFTLSQSGLIVELNLSGANLFGETRSVVQGKHFQNFLAVQSKEIFTKFIQSILISENKQACEVEINYLRVKRTLYLVGVVDETKEKYFISAADISALKATEQKLTIALEKAEESDQLKTSFLQNLRHEIRTPMNALIGFTNLLTNPTLSDKNRNDYASIIVNSANQLLTIINDVIAVSLLETNQDQINESEFYLNDLLKDLHAIFKPQALNKNLSFELTIPQPDNNLCISTDKSKLYQVISNLLINALKFTHEGEIAFGYTIKASSLVFFIKDTGIGIDPSIHQKIFERFRQASTGSNRKYGGTGLGLSISKGLVELLGGKIWVESIPNKGSNFQFSLPLKPIDRSASTPIKRITGTPVLLIAEDDEMSFHFLQLALSKALACEIYHARTGEEAVRLVRSKPEINFVLMDVNMPIMSGDEATAIIRDFRPDLYIVAQTGYDLFMAKEKYGPQLFSDYMSKPIDEVSLIARIKLLFA